MLTNLLTQDMIQVSAQEMDWQEAIKQCATPLLTNGAIEARYVTAMIAKVEEFDLYKYWPPDRYATCAP